MRLPEGIQLLPGIDPAGLQAPIWSPDGKSVAAAYVILPMPDLMGFFGPESRHDIVTIDTETWETTILVSGKGGYITAGHWLPDNKSFTMLWPEGPQGTAIYLFETGSPKTSYFSEWGILSPNLEAIAIFDEPYVTITEIHTGKVSEFKAPIDGTWEVDHWSPDMNSIALLYREHEQDGFNNIYLLELNSGKFSQFTTDQNYIKGRPLISPDGQLLAYTIWRFVESEIEEKFIISNLDLSCEWTLPIDDVNDFAWSPDSQKMFLIGDKGVYLADLNTIFGSDFSNRNDCP